MNIAGHITDLLYLHDCVIVPGLGGFISSSVPAKIDTGSNEFFPPSVKVAFNAGLVTNDGLLANSIATVENTTFREALFEIKDWVDACRKTMASGDQFLVEGLGSLLLNPAGQIEFEPSGDLNFSAESFGLPYFTATAVRHLENEEANTENVRHISPWHRIIPETLKWVAVLAPFMAFALWGSFNGKTISNYVHNYTGMYSWVRSTPGKTMPEQVAKYITTVKPAVVQPVESPSSVLAKSGEQLLVASISHQSMADRHISISQPASPVVDIQSSGNEYHIIGGAFREYANALKLIAQLSAKGYPAAIVDTTARGLYVVSFNGCASADEALAKLREIRHNGFPAAWILKKSKV